MSHGQGIGLAFLVVAVIASGVAVVYAKNASRALFVELQQVRLEKDQADMEWGRLQLELATRGALGRVMAIASERLQMQVPDAEQIVVVE
ncbi:MAG: cell division protein FtsL [Gammaproteobacteria bacterium]|nr:cell division protein FtsL [Gammaproteobacteria bacterium]